MTTQTYNRGERERSEHSATRVPHSPSEGADRRGALLVVDPRVTDWRTLARCARPGTALLVLDGRRDGLEQIVEHLHQIGCVDAIHIVSHAQPGLLCLGASRLEQDTLRGHLESLSALRGHVADGGGLLFYGCRLAAGPKGAALVQAIAAAAGLPVAASLTLTGSEVQGGDWDLAFRVGGCSVDAIFSREVRTSFRGLMAVTFSTGSGATLPSLAFGTRIVAADFNNDGKLDLLYQTSNTSGAGWALALGNGDGTFATPIIKPAGSAFTSGPLSGINFTQFTAGLLAVDLDGDGRTDLIDAQSGAVPLVYRNTGSGFVQVTSPFPSQAFAGRMIVADFNNDGYADVLDQATNNSGSDITLYLNRGDGSIGFTAIAKPNGAAFAGGPLAGLNFSQITTSSVYAVDLNGDGRTDIIDAQGGAGGTPVVPLVYQNNGTGFTAVASPFGGQPFAGRFAFGDFNSDGYIDVLNQTSDSNGATSGGTVVSASGITLYLNAHNGTIGFTTIAQADGGTFASGPFVGSAFTLIGALNLLAADFDRDGDTDIIDSQSNSIRYLVQGSNGGGDGSPPTLVATSPADNATGVASTANITLTFDEAVTRASGNVTIVRVSDGSVFEQIAIGDSRITGSGATWTINPAGTFAAGVEYAVRIDRGAFVDSDNAAFAGITDSTKLSFTALANTPPTLHANTGLTLAEGGSGVLTPANLDFNDAEQGDTAIVYTITAPATNGTLFKAGAVLGVGGTFTQDDITQGRISYAHNGSETATAAFGFSVSDGAGGSVPGQTFSFSITPVNDTPTASNLSTAETYTEDTPLDLANIVVADVDSATVTAKLTLSNAAAGALTTATSGTVTSSYDAATGEWTASGAVADVNILLAGVRFNPAANFNAGFTITTSVSDGVAPPVTGTKTVTGIAVDDSPLAVADSASTAATGSVTGQNVLTNDTDVDGGPRMVASVNGSAAAVGTQIALASGALVVVNADGTYSYDPNGKFAYLVSAATAASTGASNGSASDSFTYSLNGGASATVTITITGVDGVGDQLRGTGADDTLAGTPNADLLMLNAGGSDTASGGGGDDGFYMGAAWSAGDRLDGGPGGLDQVGIQGDYSGGLTLGASSLTSIEELVFLPGSDARFGDTSGALYSYRIATSDGNVAAGQQLVVQANTLRAGENLTFDGSAETDGSFLFYGGQGSDHLTGGQQNDGFFFGVSRFGGGDTVDGQGGAMDQLGLQGDYSGPNAIVFGAGQLTSVEMIVVLSGADTRFNNGGSSFSYTLTMNDGNAVAGAQMTVQANTLRAGEVLKLDASGEHDATYRVFGGSGDDQIIGGDLGDQLWGNAGSDTLIGGSGADQLHGGAGADKFVYLSPGDSTAAARDHIYDFAAGDLIDLSAIGLSSFAGQGFSHTAGQVVAIYGSGVWLIEGDVDGDGAADISIEVDQSAGYVWTTADFHLAASTTSAHPFETAGTHVPDSAVLPPDLGALGPIQPGSDHVI